MKKVLILLVVAVVFMSQATAAFAGGGASGGALESTQLLNKAELIKQVAEEVQSKLELIKQYQNMLQNTMQLPQEIWSEATGVLSNLQNLLSSAESLSLGAAFDFEKFKLKFPGYRDLQAILEGEEEPIDFSEEYKGRVENWQRYAEGVLETNNMVFEDINDKQEVIEKLQQASTNSEGQMQALQAGNQIATFMVQQLTQMRTDIARQIDLQTEIANNEEQAKTDEDTAIEQALGTWKTQSPGKEY
jgi:P-type conjugative transfer protein TrbJ